MMDQQKHGTAAGGELPRFVITKIAEEPGTDSIPPAYSAANQATSPDAVESSPPDRNPRDPANNTAQPSPQPKVESCAATENEKLMATGTSAKHMALYEEEGENRPFVSRVINRLANYQGGIVPNLDKEMVDEPDTPDIDAPGDKKKKKKKKKQQQTKKLGTVLGVFFPCVQNIFGVLLFIRLVWVVGTAGCLEGFILAGLCCACTMTTSISMSAIATNGVVAGGGSYFMISRALGPEFGGAVGLLFYLGTTVASSMYFVGAVEIFMQYMAPSQLAIFGPINIPSNAYNCYRVYGTVLIILMFICGFIGVKFVSKFSPFALFCVIFSIICTYIGIFLANPDRGPRICFLGDRLLAYEKIWNDTLQQLDCHARPEGPIYQMYCGNVTDEEREEGTDPDCAYFLSHNVSLIPGIPGLNMETFKRNFASRYTKLGHRIGGDEPGNRAKGDILCDISASFIVLIGIFFPSVTGIMAGSNRSGDLADAQKSIPIGTVTAVTVTSIVYMSCLLLFGASVEGQFLRDKFGESIGGAMLVSQMAWPNPWVIVIGSFLSTCGAGLQSLFGAPRLLQAIAADGVIPFLNPFALANSKGEPRRALYLTTIIAECGVLLANVDIIAPVITMFFLMCYCFTNLACAVQTILHMPNWRPRFRFYHWTLSVFGVCLCVSLMFMSSWQFAIIAILLAASIYKYIEYKGAEKEWGDGIRGLAMSAARYALLRLEEGPPHVKNWRPQLLVLVKVGENMEPKYRKLLTFASQLKAGKGLTLVVAVIEGEHSQRHDDAETARQHISDMMKREKTKGFAEVIVATNVSDGLAYLIQGAGLGGLKHNTVLMGWPHSWKQDPKGHRAFIDTLKIIRERHLAAMIIKGVGQFPENGDRLGGTIDIWWIVHEGGLLMLLPFLLTQGKVWRKCKLRIFTVAQVEDNSIQMKKDLELFLYHLRINAEVQVIELPESDISAYTYERTLMAEQRNEMLSKMHLKKNSITPQMIVDQAHLHRLQAAAHSFHHVGSSVSIPIDEHPSETEAAEELREKPPPPGGVLPTVPEPGHDNHVVESDVNNTVANNGEDQDNAAEASNPEDEAHWNVSKDQPEAESDMQKKIEDADAELLASQKETVEPPKSEEHHHAGGKKFEVKMHVLPSSSEEPVVRKLDKAKIDSQDMRRMTTAIRMNQVIKQNSLDAKLVIVNLPPAPKDSHGEKNYMDFLEALTEGMERLLLVSGGGREVITIYS